MKLLSWLKFREKRQTTLGSTCSASDESPLLWGELGKSILLGEASKEQILSIPSFWAAIKTISEAISSLPINVYERTENGAIVSNSHPVQRLLTMEANEEQTSFDFFRTLFVNACMGNAYAVIGRNGTTRPDSLYIVDPSNIELFRDKSNALWYVVRQSSGSEKMYRPKDIIHLKGISLEGIEGLDVGRIHKTTIKGAREAQIFAGEFYANGAHVSGALVYPQELTKEQVKSVEKKITRHSGSRNAGKTMILDAGVDYKKMGLDMEEAGLIPYRNMAVDDTARIFGVPAHLLAQLDRATFNNIEVMNTQFVTLCLRPWVVQAEQELSRKLLSESEKRNRSHFIDINLDGLLRGDTEARASYYNTMFNIGAMSPNDVRRAENLNSRDGGDVYFTPLNMSGNDNENVTDNETESNEPTA